MTDPTLEPGPHTLARMIGAGTEEHPTSGVCACAWTTREWIGESARDMARIDHIRHQLEHREAC